MPVVITYDDSHFEDVAALWREAFPSDPAWNAAEVAISEKRKVQPDLFLVAVDMNEVVGSVIAGYDGYRGWISRIAVRQSYRHQGIGRALIVEAENRLAAIGCRKINLQVAGSNKAVTDFYKKIGYSIEERVSMSKLVQQI